MSNIKNIKIWTLVYFDEGLQKWKGSIRSREYDVSQIAIQFNGGGHKNASGGRIDNFKESFLYEDIKSQVQSHLEMRDEWDLWFQSARFYISLLPYFLVLLYHTIR